MKKLKLFGFAIVAVAITLIACEKNNNQSLFHNDSKTEKLLLESNCKTSIKVDGIQMLRGTLKRPIRKRPRDGRTCFCGKCFGFCVVYNVGSLSAMVELNNSDDGMNNLLIVPIDENYSDIYFIDDMDHFENEFGVDNEMNIDIKNIIPFAPLAKTIKVNTGLYVATKLSEWVNIEGQCIEVFGSVRVKTTLLD